MALKVALQRKNEVIFKQVQVGPDKWGADGVVRREGGGPEQQCLLFALVELWVSAYFVSVFHFIKS